jgi:hypothetical protein
LIVLIVRRRLRHSLAAVLVILPLLLIWLLILLPVVAAKLHPTRQEGEARTRGRRVLDHLRLSRRVAVFVPRGGGVDRGPYPAWPHGRGGHLRRFGISLRRRNTRQRRGQHEATYKREPVTRHDRILANKEEKFVGAC